MNRISSNTSTTRTSALATRMSRRSLLRGAAIGAGGAAALATFGAGSPVHAAAPPATISRFEASNGTTLFVEPVAGRQSGDNNAWRPTGHIYVRNDSAQVLNVVSTAITYQGGSAPTGRWVATPANINPGKEAIISIPEDRLLPFPIPETITFQVECAGYNSPVVAVVPLGLMSHHTADHVLPFPMKSSECAPGVFLATGTNHGYGSNHGGTREQRFAYDFHARRWNGSGWSTIKAGTDGSQPEDYLIWGQPVYAVANAQIVAGYRNFPDDPIDVDTSPGGNSLWLRMTAGDGSTAQYALYAHLQQGSIPPELVPVEGGPGPMVTKGQFLGLVGKSGTKKPHLHFHIQRGISKYMPNATVGSGLPIRFPVLETLGFEHFDPDAPGSGWKNAVATGIGESCLVNGEAPAWVGPVKTTGIARPGGGYAIDTNDPGLIQVQPQMIFTGR